MFVHIAGSLILRTALYRRRVWAGAKFVPLLTGCVASIKGYGQGFEPLAEAGGLAAVTDGSDIVHANCSTARIKVIT